MYIQIIHFQLLFSRLINLVKNAAVGKMRLLRLLPAAEYLINGKQIYFWKTVLIFFCNRFELRTIIIFGGDLLPSSV